MNRRFSLPALSAALLALVLATGVALAKPPAPKPPANSPAATSPAASSPRPVAPPAAPAAPPARIDDIAATERSVVRVVTVAVVRGEVVGFGHGSGFAISPTRILTNAHVVSDAAEYPENVVIGIVPSEGSRSYPGRLIRIDRRRDLALVELVQGRLPPASLFTGSVAQRSTVYALGYPGNVDLATARNMNDFITPSSPVASDGIISALSSLQGVGALVHDADIARGNSGGPLVDRCGRVVGVNNAISRSDDGDSPFSFAISIGEVVGFLQTAGQSFTGVAIDCLSADEARARNEAMTAEERRIAAEAAAASRAAQAARDAEALQSLRAQAQSRSENYMALAFALFGGAILAGAASFLYQSQNKPRERRAAIIAGAVLAAGAVILFLLRPDPADVYLPRSDPPPGNEAGGPDAAIARQRYGALTCIVDRSRGRITVSAAQDVALSITADGCVNGRTQYVTGPGGVWSRTLVPEQDSTVTRISYDPATGQSVTQRYLLPLAAMESVRRQRGAVTAAGCTTDTAQIDALRRRELAIAALLPPEPNEELISACRADALAAPADQVSRRTP